MHNKMIAHIMALVMVFALILTPATPAFAQDGNADGPITEALNADDAAEQWQPLALTAQKKPRVIGEIDDSGTEPARYTVLLESPPMALYRGGLNGLDATNPGQTGANRLALETRATAAYAQHLVSEQAAAMNTIAATIGRNPEIVFGYQITLNGYTLELTPQEAREVVALDGIQSVERDTLYELQTDAGPAWIGAPAIWDGSAVPDGLGNRGEGVVVGVLDSGINDESPSFATVAGDGYINTNPRDRYYGVCDPESEIYEEDFNCTEKLIGGWNFIDSGVGPVDNHGHGSHTASTAAGNRVPKASVNAPGYTYDAPISGVAPRANIIAYKVCYTYGCPTSAILAGIEQATLDEVDVINYSIGSWWRNPWSDSIAMGFLAASETGVAVVTAAGNSGPSGGTIGAPANAPWLISVGASTHNRKLTAGVVDLSGGATEPPVDILGKGMTAGYGPAPIVYAGFLGNPYCSSYSFDPDAFTDEIVVCDHGAGGLVAIGENVRDAGGKGMIFVNGVYDRATTVSEPHVIPTAHISFIDGLRLKLWLASGSGHTATISGTTVDLVAENGDVMASFSSRGPNTPLPDVIKPDLTAPGVDVFAAYTASSGFAFSNGTSMSSPHIAGATALVKAVHPDWTPAEIKSALMLTAAPAGVRKEDGTTSGDPFDSGAGRVDLTGAALAGFVLDESSVGFENANPYAGGDATALNLPSLSDSECVASCSWTRVLRSTQDSPVEWTIDAQSQDGLSISAEPSSFTLAASGVQTITITASATAETLGRWAFGQVNFSTANEELAAAHFPVAIYSSAGELADINLETRREQGAYTINDMVTISMDSLESTIYADIPESHFTEIGYDSSTYSPYDDLESVGVTWTLRTLTDTTKIFIAAISKSTSVDLDLYVGYDANGDGRPNWEEELCVPFTYGANERCELEAPLAAGDYWVMVYNYYSYTSFYKDNFVLSTLSLDEGDTGNLTLSGPATVEGGQPFDLMVNWDVPDMTVGDAYIGLIEMGNASTDKVVLDAEIRLERLEDDVQFGADSIGLWPGRTVNYTIDLIAEAAAPGNTVDYTLVATLPPGVTYTPGSASLEPTSVEGNTLTWKDVELTKSTYTVTDSLSDPNCDTSEGGYTDLEDYYIYPDSTISGDDFIHNIDSFYGGIGLYSFFGVSHPAFYVTANGFGTYDPEIGDRSDINTDLPDPAAPNNLIAPFWRDLEVVYEVDYDSVRGVSIAGRGYGYEMVVEFDDVEPAPAGSTEERYDFEIVLLREVSDIRGDYEIVLAYDNLNGALTPATIGIEDADGALAHKYAYNDAELSNGLMICYDVTTPTTVIAFQAVVDEESAARMATTPVVTTLDHSIAVDGYFPLRAEVEHEFYDEGIEQFFLPIVEQ